jgi:hypothetical protein
MGTAVGAKSITGLSNFAPRLVVAQGEFLAGWVGGRNAGAD